MMSAITDTSTGITYFDHRGSTIGWLPGGREWPVERKATPPPYLSSGTSTGQYAAGYAGAARYTRIRAL
jgi:hypothetical protein